MGWIKYRCRHCGLTPKQEKVACSVCGDEFHTARGAKYCSDACKKKAWRRSRETDRVCEECGVSFKGTHGKRYCSGACRTRVWRSRG